MKKTTETPEDDYTFPNQITFDDLLTDPEPYARASHETIIGQYGDSEFLQAVEGTEASEAWAIINELMEILKRLQPKIYESVLNRLKK